MSDTFGALPIPLPAPADPTTQAVGDPALDVWASYFKAVVNANGGAAWAAAFPRRSGTQASPGAQIPPVLATFTHQPTDETIAPFNENALPALFVYRASGPGPKYEGIDRRVARDVMIVLWVFPTGSQAADRIRAPYVNGLVKILEKAVEDYRDPAWVYPGDTDPTAATLAPIPEAIKLGVATATTAQSYSGAALDGATGSALFAPPRAALVTCEGAASDYVDGSAVKVTGLDVLGRTVTRDIVISTAGIPGTFASDHAFTRITQIDVDAQATTAGTLRFGLGPYAGKGSLVLSFAPQGITMQRWRAQPIAIPMTDGRPRYYDAAEITFDMYEVLEIDLTRYDALAGVEQQVGPPPGGGYVQTAWFLTP